MKKVILITGIISLFFFSCQRNEGRQAAAIPPQVEQGEAAAAAEEAAHRFNHGYALRVNTAFYTLENDTGSESDRTRWAASLPLGERLTVIEPRRLTFAGDGVVYNFLKVRRDVGGAEGFVFAAHVAQGGDLAVIVDERANLFTSPRPIDVTGNIIPRQTVAVSFPETEHDGFVRISAFDPAARVNRQGYVRTASISRRASDVQSSILLQTARPLGETGAEGTRRTALLEGALFGYPDSVFIAEIQDLLNPNAVVILDTENVSRPFMDITEDNVNVRDLPDQIAGRVIGRLYRGDYVIAHERTVDEFTVGGQRSRWYRIVDPYEGWVFGAFLE